MNEITVSAIIACAGGSTRMNGVNKQLLELDGIPVAVRSMLAFQGIEQVTEIVVSAREQDVPLFGELAEKYGITKFKCAVKGGETRQQSVFAAFMETDKTTRYIAVHDGARPLVDPDCVRTCIRDASVFGGSVLGVPVKDTIKLADGGMITDTLDRRKLFAIQTPQIFRRDIYVKGINFARDNELDFTDDCQLAEAVGAKINLTLSDYRNIKITTPEDMAVAEVFLKNIMQVM
ncbi:MAG: 2-C-methyl-D-erythritol 4-phosphate cytidylyltransferase [Prevotella sp.]|nr:2-C-methyl-D-erythritol 4-phosphate cytidylyltransferase [Prevotella sp.]